MKRAVLTLAIRLCLVPALVFSGHAQSLYIDSLHKTLEKASGEARVNTLNKLSDFYSRKQAIKPIALAKEALELSQKLNYDLGKAYAAYNLGHHLVFQGNYSQALNYLFTALRIYEQTDFYQKKALVLKVIGHVYNEWGAYQHAIEYYHKQLDLGKQIKDTSTIGSAYLNLSYTFLLSKKPSKALKFIDQALSYLDSTKDTLGQTMAKANQAKAYFQLRDYKKSQRLLLEAFHWYKSHHYQGYEQFACADLAKLHLHTNQLDSALYYAHQGQAIALTLKSKSKIKEVMGLLYQIYKKRGNEKRALIYLEQAKIYQDSILTEEKRSSLVSQDLLHQLEKYKNENRSLKAYRDSNERSKYTQYIIGISVVLVLSSLLIIGYILYRNNRYNRERTKLISKNRVDIILQNKELKRQHHDIEEKNEQLRAQHLHIYNSIRAAQTIQQAILPQESVLQDLLFDYFVLFRPRHIVSGDFYWISSVGTQFQTITQASQYSKTLFAVVDSTGHGVPGAFMSMVGNTLLDRIVKIERVTKPSEILQQLNLEVFLALQQNRTNNDEGMEMAICSFEKISDTQTRVTFAGARRPLYVVRNGLSATGKKLQIIKGARRYIGGKRNIDAKFTDEELILENGDAIYMCSDGYADQNNVQRRKFGSERLTNTLLENVQWPMAKQQQMLTDILEAHQDESEQRDDILVAGVRIT